ncbi:MAG: glycosyltransferase family 4 protein [Anaeromyxobacter sp.]
MNPGERSSLPRNVEAPRRWILVSAHHCAPEMGSEHAVGWNYVKRLARVHDLLLITQDNEFRPAIEQALAGLDTAGHRVEPHFVRHGARSDGRKNNLRVFYYLTYILYQWRVLRLAQALCGRRDVRAIHHLTIVGFREPGFLWLLQKPFVWGPVGGLVFTPPGLFDLLSPKMRAFQVIRNLITAAQFHCSLRVRLAFRKATRNGRFIAATEDIGRRFTAALGGDYVRIPETGAEPSASQLGLDRQAMERPLRLLWVGALIDIKPMEPLLEAIASIEGHRARIQLDVVGDGDSAERYRECATRLRVNAVFHGWKPHAEVQRMYGGADLFVLFSLKDLTTNVVFEALGQGVPVLCLDHHGYSEIVDAGCGYKLPITGRDGVVLAAATVLRQALAEPQQLESLRAGALARAREFSWDRNVAQVSAIYAELAGGGEPRPAAAGEPGGARP